eukprot:COSAG06_NODE_1329_length_9848_cov_10.776798_5_plen_384_part_00
MMMESPLTAGPSLAEAEAPTAPAQPLPQELRKQVRRMLLQPPRRGAVAAGESEAASRQRQARLAGGAVTGYCVSVAYPMFRAFTLAGAEGGGVAQAALSAVVGVTLGALLTPQMFREVIPHALAQLDAPVGPKAAGAVVRLLKGGRALLVYCLIFFGGLSVLVLVESKPETALQWASALNAVALSVPLALAGTAWIIGQNLAFLLAEDKVAQLVAEVQRATAATADYGAVTSGVYRAHTNTTRLSVLMQRHVLGGSAIYFAITFTYLYVALGPRPPLGPGWGGFGSWYNVFLNEYVCVALSTFAAGFGVFILMAPAKVTSACQRVADAVNDLRVTAKADGTAELATAEELHRIEGLKRYINELNRDQGLGFVLLRKKITFTFV